MRLVEVPCDLRRDKRNRKPNLKTWRDGWRHLRLLLLYSPFKLFFVPGLVLVLLGLSGLILLPLPFGGLDEKHLITSAALSLFGIQIISFGLASKLFSNAEHIDENDRIIPAFRKFFSMKNGLRIGGALILSGAAILLLLGLSFNGFFHLPLHELVRYKLGIWGIMLVLFGVHTVFSSFFFNLSLLR